MSVALLTEYLQGALDAPGNLVTQFFAPNATAFSVLVLAAGDGLGQNVWLLMTPNAAYATGTITLPDVSLVQDGQEVLVSTTQAVTALTVTGNGAVINGAPTTLAANASFRLKFAKPNNAWYRIA